MGAYNNLDDTTDKLIDLLKTINTEFESLESFLEKDEEKSDRFRGYLKRLYDYIKIQDDHDDHLSRSLGQTSKSHQSATNNASSTALPELIIDKNLVDLEQIYQQLQLYNQNSDLSATSASINLLTKFFSKCLVQLDNISFNLDTKTPSKSLSVNSLNKKTLASSIHSDLNSTNDNSVDAEGEEDDFEEEEDFEDDDEDDNESVDNLIKFSKEKVKSKIGVKEKSNFGIPDGSDSEISDFEVEENGQEDDEDEEEEEEELDDEKFADNDKENEDNIDSDEVDDDLVDLYQDLGDEKEVLGIGKPVKSFDQVDFDREDFGLVDDEEEEETPKSGKKSNDLFDQDTKDEKSEEKMSSFEKRQEKLKETIEEIHDSMLKNLEDKPWQLKGEVNAKTRPQDSLLEEYVEFDHTTRQAPIINAATTEQIEKMIKQRIKDKSFDDVERKVKPAEMHYEYKKQVVLDHEKSKLGLGQVYEQDYLKQQQQQQEEDKPKEQAANPKHEEIRKQLQSLFIKLDALSNFHFTPKAPVPEVKVVSNMPTIAMEEVAPVNVADTNILAPEEVKAKINALPKSKSEETKADKNRNLRIKKLISKKKKADREKRLQIAQALDPDNAKVNKEIAMNKLKIQAKNLSKNIKILKQDNKEKSDKAYKSSSAFFKQLQENSQLSKKVAKKKPGADENVKSSKKLKL